MEINTKANIKLVRYSKKDIYNKLLEIISNFPSEDLDSQNGISDDFRAALKGKLDFLNQYTLQTKLRQILENVISLLPDDFIDDKASNTRHSLAHHDEKQKKKAAIGEEMLQIYHTLSVILQACLLRELGFSDESIKEMISRNRKFRREWHSSGDQLLAKIFILWYLDMLTILKDKRQIQLL